jgi:WD40 repeat protein
VCRFVAVALLMGSLRALLCSPQVTALWWDGSGMLLSAGYDGIVRQWDVFSGTCLLKLQGHSNAGITDFVCSRSRPSGRDVSRIRSTDSFGSELVSEQSVMRLVTVAWDGTVRLWESTAPIPFRL